VIAYLKRIIYLIYFRDDNSLLIEIDLGMPVSVLNEEKKDFVTIIKETKKHLLFHERDIFLPIIPELEASFNPGNSRTPRIIWIGAKLEREEKEI
jgi:hypothetical protein